MNLFDATKLNIYPASLADYAVIENMWRYYVYDMGRYCGFIKGWQCPLNLSFVPDDLSNYFVDPAKKVLLVTVGNQLAGFVFLNEISNSSVGEWSICEFFIGAKFQSMGVGQRVAKELFARFPGKWSLSVIAENVAALKFWRKIINEVSGAQCTEVFKTAEELSTLEKPNPYAMIFFNFKVSEHSRWPGVVLY